MEKNLKTNTYIYIQILFLSIHMYLYYGASISAIFVGWLYHD